MLSGIRVFVIQMVTYILVFRFLPFMTPLVVPDAAEVQNRLAYVSGADRLERVESSGVYEYIK